MAAKRAAKKGGFAAFIAAKDAKAKGGIKAAAKAKMKRKGDCDKDAADTLGE